MPGLTEVEEDHSGEERSQAQMSGPGAENILFYLS